jgi:hypothetical protein
LREIVWATTELDFVDLNLVRAQGIDNPAADPASVYENCCSVQVLCDNHHAASKLNCVESLVELGRDRGSVAPTTRPDNGEIVTEPSNVYTKHQWRTVLLERSAGCGGDYAFPRDERLSINARKFTENANSTEVGVSAVIIHPLV